MTGNGTDKKSFPFLKLLLGIAALVALFVLYRVLPVTIWLKEFQSYVRGLGALGYVLYVVVYAVCCVMFVPASVLTLGAGAIFGVVKGSIIVIIGATLGSTLSFLLARTVMRKKVESMTAGNPKFRALDQAITREGARIVFLCRMAVVFPFTYINYAFGLTGIRVVPYTVATFFGIMPLTPAFVYIGHAAATAATESVNTVKLAVYIGGGIAALAVSLFIGRIATQAIRKAGVQEN